jgi:hypothetical protein
MPEKDGNAASAPQVPLDADAKRLLLDQKKAEARKAIAEARKAEQAALLPDLKIDVPEEKLDAGEKASPFAEVLAYGELAAGERIFKLIDEDFPGEDSLKGTRLLLIRSLDLERDHGAYVTLKSLRQRLADAVAAASAQLDKGKPQGKQFGAISAVIGLALGALPTILSLARHNTTVRGRDFTISANAVSAALAEEFRKREVEVIVAGFTTVPENQIFKDIDDLQQKRDALAEKQISWKVEHADPSAARLEVAAYHNERRGYGP